MVTNETMHRLIARDRLEKIYRVAIWIFVIAWAILPDVLIGPVDDILLIIAAYKWYKKIAKFLVDIKQNLIGAAIGLAVVFSLLFFVFNWFWWIALLVSLFAFPLGALIQSKLRRR